MFDDIRDIADYYNRDPEREHRRLEEHRLEFDLTWRYLENYLPSEGSILEIGAATGRYTLPLAQRGFAITAVDISSAQLQLSRGRILDEGLGQAVNFLVADARDLRSVSKKDFDAVLLMGPLYHLVEEEDRKKALKEAHARLRKGGVIFSAFISRYGIFGDVLKNIPDIIEQREEIRSVLDHGRDTDDYPNEGFRAYCAVVSEIAPLHQWIGFETLALVGVEPAISADDESYNRLDDHLRQLWLDLFFEISTKESLIGASRHLLYIGRKV
jgi:SAM-dependent methyltransferase